VTLLSAGEVHAIPLPRLVQTRDQGKRDHPVALGVAAGRQAVMRALQAPPTEPYTVEAGRKAGGKIAGSSKRRNVTVHAPTRGARTEIWRSSARKPRIGHVAD
jgi:hypothetical protein